MFYISSRPAFLGILLLVSNGKDRKRRNHFRNTMRIELTFWPEWLLGCLGWRGVGGRVWVAGWCIWWAAGWCIFWVARCSVYGGWQGVVYAGWKGVVYMVVGRVVCWVVGGKVWVAGS